MDMCVQLWLRSATIDDVLEFLHHAPLPEKGAEELCLELSSFKKNKKPSASATPHPGDTSSSNGGDAKLFSHFFYWGMLIGCGDCRNVHPAGVGGTLPAEAKQRRDRARAAEQGLFEDVARSAAARGGRHSGWDKDMLVEVEVEVLMMRRLRRRMKRRIMTRCGRWLEKCTSCDWREVSGRRIFWTKR